MFVCEMIPYCLFFQSLTLKTVHGRKIFHTWERCEEMIANGQVKNIILFIHTSKFRKDLTINLTTTYI